MTVKKSSLEKKWYYRLAKVFFYLLPIGAVAYYYFSQKLEPLDLVSQKNLLTIGIGLIAYGVIITLAWRIFLYLFFGGLENDLHPKKTQQLATAQPTEVQNNGLAIIVFLIILTIIGAVYYSEKSQNSKIIDHLINSNPSSKSTRLTTQPTQPVNNKGHEDSSTRNGGSNSCIPTGCGSQWRCTGSYYLYGVEISVNGCFPTNLRPSVLNSSWSGTCRQCP